MNDNKKILATRLKSITHYTNEISEYEEAIKTIQSVRQELVLSLAEFFPFYNNDILMFNDNIFKFIKLQDTRRLSNNEIEFKCLVSFHDGYYGKFNDDKSRDFYIILSEIDQIKKLN